MPSGELAQAHVGDIARDGRLRAIESARLELIDEHPLRAHVLGAHDLADGVLAAIALLSHIPHHSQLYQAISQ